MQAWNNVDVLDSCAKRLKFDTHPGQIHLNQAGEEILEHRHESDFFPDSNRIGLFRISEELVLCREAKTNEI